MTFNRIIARISDAFCELRRSSHIVAAALAFGMDPDAVRSIGRRPSRLTSGSEPVTQL